jgi:hypothetical protein
MIPIPKFIGVMSCVFVLTGLSVAYAAHNSGESKPAEDRGSQGNQDLIKGDSTPKKGDDEKVDEAKVKENTKKAREEFEKRNAKGQAETRDKRKGDY